MKKVVRIDENQLINIIERAVKEQEEEKFTIEPHVGKIPREKQLQGMFGEYNNQIPNDILRYMRKNPQLIMNRLAKIYGNNFLKYTEKAHKNANK
jgi:hypothetical protein